MNSEEGSIEIIYSEIQREKWTELQEPWGQYQKVTGVQASQEKDIRAEKNIFKKIIAKFVQILNLQIKEVSDSEVG